MHFIDTHCHLDSSDFRGEVGAILARCAEMGVKNAIIPGADFSDLKTAQNLAQTFSEIYFAIGIHPNEIHALNSEVLAHFSEVAKDKKCLAVGEIGLDYHYKNDDATKKAQERGFRAQIELANALNLPIIIHTRESNADTVAILKDYENKIRAVIFHCFGGDLALIDALKCPCFYGIGGVVSFKNANLLRENIPKIPREGLLLETDAPYLAPTPHRGKRNSPEFIPLIATHLAEILGINVEEIARITSKNANHAFGI